MNDLPDWFPLCEWTDTYRLRFTGEQWSTWQTLSAVEFDALTSGSPRPSASGR